MRRTESYLWIYPASSCEFRCFTDQNCGGWDLLSSTMRTKDVHVPHRNLANYLWYLSVMATGSKVTVKSMLEAKREAMV